MYRLKQAHVHVPHFRKKGPIDVPGSLILRPMFAAHPYNHFCTEYPPGEKWAPFPAKMTPNNGYEPGGGYSTLAWTEVCRPDLGTLTHV